MLVTAPPSICLPFAMIAALFFPSCGIDAAATEGPMRGASILVALASAIVMVVGIISPAKAWYDRYGRWHPNAPRCAPGYCYRPPPPPVYYTPPAYYRPPPPVYGYGPGVSIGVRIP